MKLNFSFFIYLFLVLFFTNLHVFVELLRLPVEYGVYISRFFKISIILGFTFLVSGLCDKLIVLVFYPTLKIIDLFVNLFLVTVSDSAALSHIGILTILTLYLITANHLICITYLVIANLSNGFFGYPTFILTSIALLLNQIYKNQAIKIN
jgi:hypothetical protein